MVPTPDVVTFPYLLSRRSFKNPEMTVIGVYVGWRGKKYEHFRATLLSVKDRVKAADMIGKMGEVRAHIITMVNHCASTALDKSLLKRRLDYQKYLSKSALDWTKTV